jgi:hypothetical protein
MKTSLIKNTRGSLTIDFLFATVLMCTVMVMLFGITFSLTVVEVSQYIAFSSSRNYMAAHFNLESQEALAEQKYNFLTSDSPLAILFKRDGWFSLVYETSGDLRGEYTDGNARNRARFWGTKLRFESKILGFEVPIYGTNNPDEARFTASITSFLGREPNQNECAEFMNQRWNQIRTLNSKYGSQIPNSITVAGTYDNGC